METMRKISMPVQLCLQGIQMMTKAKKYFFTDMLIQTLKSVVVQTVIVMPKKFMLENCEFNQLKINKLIYVFIKLFFKI